MSVASSQNGRTQKQRECETSNQTQKGCAVHIVHIVQWVKMCALRSGVRTQALFLSWWRKLNSCVLSSTVRTSPRRLSHTLRENGGTEETSGAESEGESESDSFHLISYLKVEEGDLSEIRLTYFPIRGRAEIARLILVQAGVDYRDIRIKREDFLKVTFISYHIICHIWHICHMSYVLYGWYFYYWVEHLSTFDIQVKSILPYGSLPILEYKGEVIKFLNILICFLSKLVFFCQT